MEQQKAIQIDSLSYNYKSDWTFKKSSALKNISLDIHSGESFGFLGPNGAGKTTTIKCILGLIRPSKGKIKIFGIESCEISARAQVGYLPEQPYFYDHLTVEEIMLMYASLAGVEKSDRKNFVLEALERVHITDRLKSKMRTLSKGLTQRVAMAQAIVAKPKLLILDEPFSGLDPIGRKEFKDLIFELKRGGTTIFMSSHILSDVEFLCDRASILVKGDLKGIYNLSQLSSTSSSKYELVVEEVANLVDQLTQYCETIDKRENSLRLVFNDHASATHALHMALHAQAPIKSFGALHGGLEEIFVQLVKQTTIDKSDEVELNE